MENNWGANVIVNSLRSKLSVSSLFSIIQFLTSKVAKAFYLAGQKIDYQTRVAFLSILGFETPTQRFDFGTLMDTLAFILLFLSVISTVRRGGRSHLMASAGLFCATLGIIVDIFRELPLSYAYVGVSSLVVLVLHVAHMFQNEVNGNALQRFVNHAVQIVLEVISNGVKSLKNNSWRLLSLTFRLVYHNLCLVGRKVDFQTGAAFSILISKIVQTSENDSPATPTMRFDFATLTCGIAYLLMLLSLIFKLTNWREPSDFMAGAGYICGTLGILGKNFCQLPLQYVISGICVVIVLFLLGNLYG